ncbi:glycosyltransferase involved in cell wall biosynthesis [Flavobacterium tiangeerense]|uniref:Glycosyltransferase involved in cell wall biosynthesis n=1 Tax=Flavobacterium tiangeerense TaxID=459471 RepID=A0ABY3FJM8_9FLAO|nr:glycosyltransferase [Flavobacterium tiangeerense]TWH99149.1 glycosyltransferase involved in cell wall biosynthesis [Flavobacterium tiangeerense]
MNIGIDASNVGGGGGITHLKEILFNFNEEKYKDCITSIIVFASQKVLNEIKNFDKLEKVTFPEFNKGLLSRVFFQLTKYDKEINSRCDLLLSITGDYVGTFKPLVGISRNMLLYERAIWLEIKQPKEVIRFWLNYQKQKKSFKNSDGIIFISQYAKEYINNTLNLEGKTTEVINHGVSQRFSQPLKMHKLISEFTFDNPFKFIYVSPVHMYKHQWNVVRAIANIRSLGYPVELHLIGNVSFTPAGEKLAKATREVDVNNIFIKNHGHVKYDEIDKYYRQSNGIIFASTCENMPNTLIESMASGTPIACSNKEPMPEFLKNNGYYFDSYDINSIQSALEKLILNVSNNDSMAFNNLEEVKKYSWVNTSEKTFDFLLEIYNLNK